MTYANPLAADFRHSDVLNERRVRRAQVSLSEQLLRLPASLLLVVALLLLVLR